MLDVDKVVASIAASGWPHAMTCQPAVDATEDRLSCRPPQPSGFP